MKEFFRRMLSEDNGNPSTVRWGVFNAIAMIWILVWGIIAVIYFNRPESLIYAIISAVVAIGGIFLVPKVVQKFAETKEGKTTNIETTIEKTTEITK